RPTRTRRSRNFFCLAGFQGRFCRKAGAALMHSAPCLCLPRRPRLSRFEKDFHEARPARPASKEDRMSMDAIADKMRAKVEGSGFTRSVKLDCGADGVIIIDGATV